MGRVRQGRLDRGSERVRRKGGERKQERVRGAKGWAWSEGRVGRRKGETKQAWRGGGREKRKGKRRLLC